MDRQLYAPGHQNGTRKHPHPTSFHSISVHQFFEPLYTKLTSPLRGDYFVYVFLVTLLVMANVTWSMFLMMVAMTCIVRVA